MLERMNEWLDLEDSSLKKITLYMNMAWRPEGTSGELVLSYSVGLRDHGQVIRPDSKLLYLPAEPSLQPRKLGPSR